MQLFKMFMRFPQLTSCCAVTCLPWEIEFLLRKSTGCLSAESRGLPLVIFLKCCIMLTNRLTSQWPDQAANSTDLGPDESYVRYGYITS